MGCETNQCGPQVTSLQLWRSIPGAIVKPSPLDLRREGRVQYFLHSPSSKLPIRDVLNEQSAGWKTEPHIEIGAENYINCCYQTNIAKFAKGPEKYLFLVTTCQNCEINRILGQRKTNQFIVGYIEKASIMKVGNHTCVKGPIYLYSFHDSIPTKEIFGRNLDRPTLSHYDKIYVDNVKTELILAHFKDKPNITIDCIQEIHKLDNPVKTCSPNKEQCKFYHNGCMRWG